jgi:hypothetical protein
LILRYVAIYPKTPDIRNVCERIYNINEQFTKINKNNGIGLRINPRLAQDLSRHSAIRELKRHDHVDIVGRQSPPHRSILFIDENVKVKKKGEKYYFFF